MHARVRVVWGSLLPPGGALSWILMKRGGRATMLIARRASSAVVGRSPLDRRRPAVTPRRLANDTDDVANFTPLLTMMARP